MKEKTVRILVVDDEQDLVWALRHSLSDEGYDVLCAYDGVQALELARRQRPNLIVLDIAMPRMDGMQVCRTLRRDPSLAAVPIIFLTVRSEIEDRVTGLNEGSDDYMIKPFDMRELKARIRALLRRSEPGLAQAQASAGKGSRIVARSLVLNLHSRQVRAGDRVAQLTPIEFDLLHYLMVHPDEVFSSEALLQSVWGSDPGAASPSLVRWHIKNLRTKIEADPCHPLHILTVSRHGYTLRKA